MTCLQSSLSLMLEENGELSVAGGGICYKNDGGRYFAGIWLNTQHAFAKPQQLMITL